MVMTLQEAYASISKDLKDLEDTLAKSMPMECAEPMKKEEVSPDPAAPAPVSPDAAAPDASPEAAPAPEAEQPVEGMEGQDDGMDVDAVAKELEGMNDEDIQSLIAILTHEMEARSGKSADADAPKAAPAPVASPIQAAPEADDGMKKQMDEMQKSLATLKSENETLKKAMKLPAPKAAVSQKIEVMEKSVKQPEALSKSEIVDSLYRLQKSGDRRVDTDLIWFANKAKSAEELASVVEIAKLKGIKL